MKQVLQKVGLTLLDSVEEDRRVATVGAAQYSVETCSDSFLICHVNLCDRRLRCFFLFETEIDGTGHLCEVSNLESNNKRPRCETGPGCR